MTYSDVTFGASTGTFSATTDGVCTNRAFRARLLAAQETVVKEVDTDTGFDQTKNRGLHSNVGGGAIAATENVRKSIDVDEGSVLE